VNSTTTWVQNQIDTNLRLKFTTGVRAILEDSRGDFWFGSHQEGVCLYNGEKLTYFTEEHGLSNNQVRSIYEDVDGVIWFEGGEGLSTYDVRLQSIPDKSIITRLKKSYNSKLDWKAGPADLWFKGDEAVGYNQKESLPGVYRWDGHQLSYHTFPIHPNEDEKFYYSVSTPFVKGKNGMFWFGTYGAAIGYNGSSFTIIDDKSLGLNDDTGHFHVRNLFEDSKGNLWIGNNGIGVWLYDGDTTINFSAMHGLVSLDGRGRGGYQSPAGSLEHVFAIGEDVEGNIWFGDRDTGAWRYDGKTMKNYTPEDGLTTFHIWQIYQTKIGELWFAMGDGAVCRFNGESFDRIL
jgi:ligand-binding sensor domain-containing protein